LFVTNKLIKTVSMVFTSFLDLRPEFLISSIEGTNINGIKYIEERENA